MAMNAVLYLEDYYIRVRTFCPVSRETAFMMANNIDSEWGMFPSLPSDWVDVPPSQNSLVVFCVKLTVFELAGPHIFSFAEKYRIVS